MKNKKAVSGIVTTVLLILISLVSLAIVWNIVGGIIKTTGEKTDVGVSSMFTGMEIQNVYVSNNGTNLSLTITRTQGEANIPSLTCAVSTGEGSGSFKLEPAPGPLATRIYYLDISMINPSKKREGIRIACAPVFSNGKPGTKEEHTTSGSEPTTPPSGSWPPSSDFVPLTTGVCTPSENCVTLSCTGGKTTQNCTTYKEDCKSTSTLVYGIYCLPESYVSWWKFDETDGITAQDTDPGANPGTLYSNGNLVRNGNAEKGTTYNWLNFNSVATAYAHSGSYGFNRTNSSMVYSSELIPIDATTATTYNLTGWFKSFGTAGLSKLYFGFAPYNKDKKPISNHNVNNVPNTETTLYAAVNPTDTVVKIVDNGNCGRWTIPGCPTGCHGRIAFDVKDNFSDLPNYNVSATINSLAVDMGAWCEVTLTAGAGVSYPTGTKIREHQSGGSYMYSAAVYEAVPASWKSYNATIQGEFVYGSSYEKWWRGTKYAKILMLANHDQYTGNYVLGVDDISLTTNPPTHTGATWATDGSKNVLKFDGDDDYVNLTGLTSTAKTYTFSLWVKSSSADDTYKYLFDSETGRLTLGWFTGTSGKIGFYDGAWHSFGDAPNDGGWHHIVYVLDAGGAGVSKMYIDNSKFGSDSNYTSKDIGGLVALSSNYGGGSGGSTYFNGSIDNVMIYNYALTPDEIKGVYCSQGGTTGC